MPTDYYVAFWNVENLYSPQNDPSRSEKLQRTIRSELTGWTRSVLNRKLRQLSKVIKRMNDGYGPDLLAVCEVENERVLRELVDELSDLSARDYDIVHADTQDGRGIDVAMIYDRHRIDVVDREVFSQFIVRRNATRDILQVSFTTKAAGNKLIVLGNHWPSRSGGELASEPYRMMAGETLAYFHRRIIDLHNKNQPVLAMGDFNDEPQCRSLVEYALGERTDRRVRSTRSRNPYFLNLMWSAVGAGLGTHYHDGLPAVLDQFLANRGLLGSSPLEIDLDTVEILNFEEMSIARGSRRGHPRRFGRPSSAKSFDQDGYSDHFPIGIVIREK